MAADQEPTADAAQHFDVLRERVSLACARRAAVCVPLWRAWLAELCGTTLLVLLSCLPGCAPGGAASPAHRALAAGLVVTMLVQSVDHISGAFFNPTVVLAAALWGRVTWRRAVCLAVAQLLGATLGAAALRALRPIGAVACVTRPAADLTPAEAVAIEAVLGGCLALANCGTWDARNAGLRDAWPVRIGLTVAGLSLAAGELTGASMNPARSFGPALCEDVWTHHWVYWAGPLGGSLVCTLLYVTAWRPAPPRHKLPPPAA